MPILLQIPFFMALFYLLRGDEFKADIRGEESFFFIPDLAANATGGVLVVLIVLYVVTMLGSSAVTAISADRNQRIIMFALPIVFVPIIINFPAGLLVYWITTNVWTVGQQLAVKKFLPAPDPVPPKADEDGDAAHAATPKGMKDAEKPGEPAPKRLSLLGQLRDGLTDGAASRSRGDADGGDGGGRARGDGRKGGAAASSGGDGASAKGGASGGNGRSGQAPPRSPRKKKKKRSGRRR